MEKAAAKPMVVKPAGGLIKELFGQLVSAQFWKDLVVFTLKTAIHVAGEMMIVAGGQALIEMGRKLGRSNADDVNKIKEKFQAGYAPPPPAAAPNAFSRGFVPSSDYRPSYSPPPPTNESAWPGLAQNFGR